jgi:hypothetical protein
MLGYFYQVFFLEKSFNPLATALEPPPISAGLHIVAWGQPGFAWQWTVAFTTIAFVSWMLRQVDISLKLRMGFEIPIAFGAVVSSWVTLQILRPIAMGAWGNGFPLGINASPRLVIQHRVSVLQLLSTTRSMRLVYRYYLHQRCFCTCTGQPF